MVTLRSTLVWLFLLLLLIVRTVWGQEKEIEIKLLEVQGNRKIDATTIRMKIATQEGDAFSVESLREDVKAVYKMGYFDNVRLESEGFEGGVKLAFVVDEKPFVEELVFWGNEEIEDDKLREKAPFRTKTFLDLYEVDEMVEKIRIVYEEEGYYGTEVLPVIRTISPEKVVVGFAIEEKDRTRIRKVGFEGNQKVSSDEIEKVMETSEYFWLTSWLTGSGVYKSEAVNADIERIRGLYLNRGYLQVQVGSPEVSLKEGKKWFEIIFPIVEGVSFQINEIAFSGNELYEDARLRQVLLTRQGDTFNRDQIRNDIMAIVDLYGEKGYAFANVVPDLLPDPATRQVKVTFAVSEGEPVRIRQINIHGNTKTRDKVIRRELRFNEQELMDTRALRRSFQRVNNLNFFENVEIVPKEVERGWVDLDVGVQEKLTGRFSVGGGYSSVDKLLGLMEIEQGNLFGRGQLLRLRTELGARRTNFVLSLREPYLFDKQLSGTIDLYNQIRSFTDYREKRIGGDVILGKSFTEYINASISYIREIINIFNVRARASQIIRDQQALGTTLTSSIGASLTRDSRDFFFDPSSGSRHSISGKWAGSFLGGDNAYYRVVFDTRKYFPLKWHTVFLIHGRLGYADGLQGKALPLGQRFFVGGINTVRGFKFGKAGFLDPLTGEIIGGNKELIFNLEYLFPLVQEARIKGVIFFDAGRGFGEPERIRIRNLRISAGGGIRWISPIGPLRLEWGYNLDRQPGESASEVEFSIGNLF